MDLQSILQAVAGYELRNRKKSELVQEKSYNFQNFFERVVYLGQKTGLNISDLPEKIGISTSMFYLYKSGKHPISAKVWHKLEQAEKAAGITNEIFPQVLSTETSAAPIEQIRTAVLEISRILDNLANTLKDGTRKPDDPVL